MNQFETEKMLVVEANVDDCTAEHLAFCMESLMANGAADAWITPIVMKKGRSAHTIHCLCRLKEKEGVLKTIFKHSTTLGVRLHEIERLALPRKELRLQIYGEHDVQVKVGFYDGKAVSVKPEYEDCKQIALETGLPIGDVSALATEKAKGQLCNN